jgi:hypothetical protein
MVAARLKHPAATSAVADGYHSHIALMLLLRGAPMLTVDVAFLRFRESLMFQQYLCR